MRFRIVTNDEEFRIQKRFFLWWIWEVELNNQGTLIVKLSSYNEAENFLRESYGKNYELDKPWIVSLK